MNEEKCGECVVTGSTPTTNENQVCDVTTKLVGIYGLQNKLKPEKWYVGQSVDVLSNLHKRYELLNCEKQPKIYHALLKYGYSGFNIVVLETCEAGLLNDREIYWSNFYNSVECGYNIRECGGSRGKHSEETKEKMRVKATGRLHTPEAIAKMKTIKRAALGGKRPPNYGTTHSEGAKIKIRIARAKQIITDEHRHNISLGNMGRIFTQETRQKISKANKGKITSTETKLKISLACKGRITSEETRRKLSIAKTGNQNARKNKLTRSIV